ncbi:MAG: CoA transferase [Acidimicrobiales bacterium]
MKRFSDLRVIEIGGSVAGAYCGKLFADRGAQVMVVGHDSLNEYQRVYLQSSKGRVNANDRASSFDPAQADVIIESSGYEPLDALELECPQAIQVQLSHFGAEGPYAQWHGTDLTDYALGGHLYLSGDPQREPLQGPANQPAYAAGLYGHLGAIIALFAREQTGVGQTVEVSQVEAMAALHQFTLLRYTMAQDVLCRMGNRFAGQGQPNGLYRCADGWVAIAAPSDQQVEAVLDATGLTHLLDHPSIDSPMDFQSHRSVLDDELKPWLAERAADEVVDLFQAMRIPTAPVTTMTSLLADPQLAVRGYWEDRHGYRVPRSPTRFSHKQSSGGRSWQRQNPDLGPLAGLRVLDLTRVWAGPLSTRMLADFGADVVEIEAPWARGPRKIPDSLVEATSYFPNNDQGDCQWNRNSHFAKYALGKRSVVLDLEQEAGREVLAEMIPHYDVIIENYSPRVMPNLGFDENRIHELNPDIIYVTMPGYGRSGPAEDWLAYGASVDSHAGLSSLIGYPDANPWKAGVAWPDPIAGLHATGAILTAIWNREADPEHGGVTIENPQIEATIAAIGDRLVEAQVNGDPTPNGNREPAYLAQGVYRCAGDDRWIAISVVDGDNWSALQELTGFEVDLIEDHDRFDTAMNAWTANGDQNELAVMLQETGVAAGAVLDAAGVMADPHLKARDAFLQIEQPEIGPFVTPLTPVILSETPAMVRRPAPLLGQHNQEVLKSDLGIGDERLTSLQEAGVIADRPPA